MNAHPVLVEAVRGGIVESMHRGAYAVVDAAGGLVQSAGDIERPVFPRSAIKVLQALPLVASGAADEFALTQAELALACASHGGEPRHAETAASMLAKAGLDQGALECGTHWPYHDGSIKALAAAGRQPSALHNNCSGKHAGFVCLGCRLAGRRGAADFVRGYVQPGHAVMREVSGSLQDATGFDLERTARGVDGCSIPTFAIPLRHLARAMVKVATGVGLDADRARAARRLRAAVAHAPEMVAGSGRFDSRVMSRLGERLFCKVGAEGMYCAALPEAGLGIALKMDDGNNARAAEVVMAALALRHLPAGAPLAEADALFLRGFSDAPMTNWNGIEVGRLRAAENLR